MKAVVFDGISGVFFINGELGNALKYKVIYTDHIPPIKYILYARKFHGVE